MTCPCTNTLVKRLKKVGLRVTPQRLAVYRALVACGEHPTAQSLFERLQSSMPSLSQATVYNTLQALVTRGLIQEIGGAGDGALHYDADLTPHINLICVCCNRIEDYYDVPVEDLARQVITQSGYQVQGTRLVFYGLCPDCQQNE